MVKIEKLKDGAVAYITRDGQRMKIFAAQLISLSDLDTLEVESGTVVYSINEELIKETTAAGKQLTLKIETSVPAPQDEVAVELKSSPTMAETVTETVAATPQVVKPAIVKPTPRSAKK